MLVTKHFIFIHVPKTGGTFIRHVCRNHLPPDWLVDRTTLGWDSRPGKDAHRRYTAIPPEFSELPVLAVVRNPWDWYVSWYAWRERYPANPADGNGGRLWAQVFARAEADFEHVVRAACTAETDDGPIAAPNGAEPRWLQTMRRGRIDYYSALLKVKLGTGVADSRIQIAKFENLRESFLQFLERNAIPVPDELAAAMRTEEPRNVSARGAYREYYDEPLRDLVATHAREMIERYDYSF